MVVDLDELVPGEIQQLHDVIHAAVNHRRQLVEVRGHILALASVTIGSLAAIVVALIVAG